MRLSFILNKKPVDTLDHETFSFELQIFNYFTTRFCNAAILFVHHSGMQYLVIIKKT